MDRLTEKISNGYTLKIPEDKSISDLEIMFNVYDRLGHYEDAEEQGLLIKFPCPIGSTVYAIVKNEIVKDVVDDYDIWSVKSGLHLRIRLTNYKDYVIGVFGKDIFLTKEEAEQKLKQIGE